MSDIVAEAREALGGITPGPWWWTGETRNRLVAGDGPDGLDREIIRCAALLHPGAADAEFIAAAPDLVRRLADEVERLRDDLRIAESVNHQCESVDAAIARVVALAEAWETCGMVDAPPTVQYMGELLRRALDGGDQADAIECIHILEERVSELERLVSALLGQSL